MKKKLTCIICPKGCALTAEIHDGTVEVTGNSCTKGKEYANSECTNPVRTVTAAVRVSNRYNSMVSVKTATPVAKNKMMDVMAVLRSTQVEAPIRIGDIILHDVCGSDIVITKEVL